MIFYSSIVVRLYLLFVIFCGEEFPLVSKTAVHNDTVQLMNDNKNCKQKLQTAVQLRLTFYRNYSLNKK